jgi:DNA processing protein
VLEPLCREGIHTLEALLPGLREKLAAIQQSSAFARELACLEAAQISIISIADAHYPQSLRWTPDPPLVLYLHGALEEEDGLAVAVVGSRKPSNYGKAMAQRFSAELVQHGFTVVSGLARGIDSQAHRSALQAGGRTIAILGSGLNVIYPPENRRLCERIRGQGAILSEFPLDTKPDRWNFPRRNRIISGLALGTLVIEAAAHSGALHTARHTLEQGREVFAIPGRIDVPHSRGANNLIKQGAKLVECVDDIVAEFPDAVQTAAAHQWAAQESVLPVRTLEALSEEEMQILTLLQPEETHIDTLIQSSKLPAHLVSSILVTLELRGLIHQLPGKFFART